MKKKSYHNNSSKVLKDTMRYAAILHSVAKKSKGFS